MTPVMCRSRLQRAAELIGATGGTSRLKQLPSKGVQQSHSQQQQLQAQLQAPRRLPRWAMTCKPSRSCTVGEQWSSTEK